MRGLFLETSALAKLYVREPGSDAMLRLLASGEELHVAALTRVEIRSALRRSVQAGKLAGEDYAAAIADFEGDWLRRLRSQDSTDAILENAVRLVDAYGLRAYDAVQLATCEFIGGLSRGGPLAFVCSDRQLRRAAAEEGLETSDPSEEG